MNEMNLTADAELFRAPPGLRGEQRAHIDAGAGNAMIARPGAEHLPEPLPRSRMWVSGFMRNTRPNVAYFSGVNGL
jgi:hypothetical protein